MGSLIPTTAFDEFIPTIHNIDILNTRTKKFGAKNNDIDKRQL